MKLDGRGVASVAGGAAEIFLRTLSLVSSRAGTGTSRSLCQSEVDRPRSHENETGGSGGGVAGGHANSGTTLDGGLVEVILGGRHGIDAGGLLAAA